MYMSTSKRMIIISISRNKHAGGGVGGGGGGGGYASIQHFKIFNLFNLDAIAQY